MAPPMLTIENVNGTGGCLLAYTSPAVWSFGDWWQKE